MDAIDVANVDDAIDVAIGEDETDLAVAGDATDLAVAASKPGKRRPVVLEWHLTIKGGVSSKPKVVPTMSVVACGDAKFARLNKHDSWFLASIVGSGSKGDARRVKILELIKSRVDSSNSSDVADDSQTGAPAPSEAVDAMDALDALDEDTPSKKRKYQCKRKRTHSLTLSLTEQPLCVDPNSPRRDVRVLARSTSSLWIHVDDIPWLVDYAIDEIECGGVPAAIDDDPDDDDPELAGSNCGVPGLRIEWDHTHDTETYTAVFTSGPCANVSVSTGMSTFTAQKWASINPPRTGSFADATYDEKRAALFEFLKQHMVTRLASQTQSVEQR